VSAGGGMYSVKFAINVISLHNSLIKICSALTKILPSPYHSQLSNSHSIFDLARKFVSLLQLTITSPYSDKLVYASGGFAIIFIVYVSFVSYFAKSILSLNKVIVGCNS